MDRIRLTLLPPQEGWDPAKGIPKYSIGYDAQFFDLESLVRMYGKEEIESFLRGLKVERRQNKVQKEDIRG